MPDEWRNGQWLRRRGWKALWKMPREKLIVRVCLGILFCVLVAFLLYYVGSELWQADGTLPAQLSNIYTNSLELLKGEDSCVGTLLAAKGFYRMQLAGEDRWLSVLGPGGRLKGGTERRLQFFYIPEVTSALIVLEGQRILHGELDGSIALEKEGDSNYLTYHFLWRVVFKEGGCPPKVLLYSVGERGYVATEGERLVLDRRIEKAAVWTLYYDPHPACFAETKKLLIGTESRNTGDPFIIVPSGPSWIDNYIRSAPSTNHIAVVKHVTRKTGVDLPKVASDHLKEIGRKGTCWEEPYTQIRRQRAAVESEESRQSIILFGTFRPLERLGPASKDDPFDSYLLEERTLRNWATLQGVTVLIMVNDALNLELIKQFNAHRGEFSMSEIHVVKHVEMNKEFKQPTYRGMFQAALKAFPEAPLIMFSNADILYTSSLRVTVDAVVSYFERVVKPANPAMRGIALFGQRTNVLVPTTFLPAGGLNGTKDRQQWWDSAITDAVQQNGTRYHDYAQDYFFMSRDLIDWSKAPAMVVGGVRFDNWIMETSFRLAKEGKAFVVDVTDTLLALHQTHTSVPRASHTKPKSSLNIELYKASKGFAPENGRVRYCPYYTIPRKDKPDYSQGVEQPLIYINLRDHLISAGE